MEFVLDYTFSSIRCSSVIVVCFRGSLCQEFATGSFLFSAGPEPLPRFRSDLTPIAE